MEYLRQVEHLKEIEENIAIKNMFAFKDEGKKDMKFYLMLAAIIIIVFLLRG